MQVTGALTRHEAEGSLDPDGQVVDVEATATPRLDRRRDRRVAASRDTHSSAASLRVQRGGELVRDRDRERSSCRVRDHPRHVADDAEGKHTGEAPLDGDGGGLRREHGVDQSDAQEDHVRDDQPAPPVAGQCEQDRCEHRRHDGETPGGDGEGQPVLIVAWARSRGSRRARRRPSRPRARARVAAGCGGAWPACATAFTSSGVTKARPDNHAHAFAACSSHRGTARETPSVQRRRVAGRASAERRCTRAPRARRGRAAISLPGGGKVGRCSPPRAHRRRARRAGRARVVTREHLLFLLRGGVAHDELEQEAVELGLGQRVGALVLDRVLRRDHDERIGQQVRACRRPRPVAPPWPRAERTVSSVACG